MDKNKEVFKKYAYEFDQSIDMIEYKYNHSLRVMDAAEQVALSLNLNNEDIFLAKFIGLTHDIARFIQWTNHKTFNDFVSFDHGDYAVKLLFEEGLINKFDVDKKYHKIIKTAIENHNKFLISPKVVGEKELLHSKIIRDADKIDIINSFQENASLKLKSDDSEISANIKENFYKNKPINFSDIKSVNDRVVEIISLLYDINFRYSLESITNKKYLESLYEKLEYKEKFKEYFDHMYKYIEERKKELC